MSKAKIQVLDPDGKFRGRLRSSKIPTPSWTSSEAAGGPNADVMACDGDPLTGTWLLFARAADNSTVLSCREHTPAQALAWSIANAVQPPAQLVVGARRYWADWQAVRNAPEAMAALTALAQPEANAGDTTSQPLSDEDLATLRRLGLISGDATSPPCITELVRDLGVTQLSNWLDAQVMCITEWLRQNVGIQVAPSADPSGPTTFSITRRWLKSWDCWRTEAHPFSQPPGVRQVAADLAAATKAMLPIVRRFGEPVEAAERLILGLEGATPHRTPRMDQAAWSIQRQIIRIDHYISCGALTGDEELMERRAEWQDRLDEFRTAEARDAFQLAVEADLSRPRDAVHHTHLLDLARDLRQHEEKKLPLDEILAKRVSDAESQCQRWQALVDYGRRFSHRSERDAEVETVCFSTQVAARRLYGNMGNAPLELRWAEEFRFTTEGLRHLARAAGLSPADGLPISRLTTHLGQIIEGAEVDLREAIDEVRVLVTEILASSIPNSAPQVKRAENEFIKCGAGWQLTFAGKTVIVPDSKGMGYIQRLLVGKHPIPAIDLAGLDEPPGSIQPAVDRHGRQVLVDLIDELAAKLEEPSTSGERETLLAQKREAEHELAQARSGSHDRQMRTPGSDATNRVRAALRRAMDAIKSEHLALHQHLDESLIGPGSAAPHYRPQAELTWMVNPTG